MKSRIMLAEIHRGIFQEKVTKGKLAVDCKSGRKLRHIPKTCHRIPNIATFLS